MGLKPDEVMATIEKLADLKAKGYPHHLINTSDAALKYLSLSTKEYPEVFEHADSGKLMAFSAGDGQSTLRSIHHKGARVDDWNGEA